MKILKSNVVLNKKTYRNIAIFTFMAVFCLLISVIGRPLVNRALDDQINKMLVVDSVSAVGYEDWQTNVGDDAIPIWFKFWHLNLTNPDEVVAGIEKPSFEEIGPWCYKELRSKINITWADNGNQVTYWTYKYFLYDPSCTAEGLSENDPIVTTNLAYMTFLNNLANPDKDGIDTYYHLWLNELLWNTIAYVFNEPLFVTVTARDLIYGYEDPLFAFLHDNVDESIPADIYIQLNLTNEQETYQKTKFTTQETGKDDIKNIANYLYWNGETQLNCWKTPEANAIYGGDGNYWPPKD